MPDPEQKDVTQADPSSAAHDQNPDAGAVTPDTGDDRPSKNVIAEYNRKLTKLLEDQRSDRQRMETLMQYVIANQTQQAPAPARVQADTEEDLWTRAQQGDRLAFDEYMSRKARREVQQQSAVTGRTQLVGAQMNALIQKYPVLNDGSHPLTQYANQAYQLLLRSGYPAGQETLLEAAKTAIADRPDLVSELYQAGASAREGARRTSAQVAQSGQTGTSLRRDPPTAESAVKVREGEYELARRMGIKDPKKAKERFLERQKSGQSALGAVSGFVHEEEF